MRTTFITSFALNLLLTVVTLIVGPDHLAVHFGAAGNPNGWATAYVYALMMAGINILLFVTFFFTIPLLRKVPVRWVSLPNQEYWTTEGNWPQMESILAVNLYQFGTFTFGLMFLVGLLVLQANLSEQVRFNDYIFGWAFGLYLVFTVYWTVKIIMAFRVPREGER